MADVLQKLLNLNFTENVLEVPKKKPATPEGMVLAYASLIIMSMLPIIFGAIRSVKHHQERTQHQKISGQKVETMTQSDAAFFPIFASMALFALYVLFKLFSKDYINLLLTGYFFVLGVLALSHLACPVVSSLVPASIPNVPFQLKFTSGKGQSNVWINYEFTSHDVVCLVCCSLVGASYLLQKHWIVNNLFGIAFAINSVELLLLNNVVTGCILLCGLFVYDIFWVFGTNVMVTVASSFEAPIKLVFPQDLIEHGFTAKNFAMIGLGDIVIPGIFIALLLRFDNSLKRKTSVYFYTTIAAYFIGLVATMFVMHLFNHAQPALLYLVPACLGTPILLALIRGDIGAMFQYEDHPSEKTSKTEDDTKKTATKSVPKTKKVK